MDCSDPDPIPWRYFSTPEGFASDVAYFRKKYPFAKEVPIHFRPLVTKMIGQMHDAEEYVVE